MNEGTIADTIVSSFIERIRRKCFSGVDARTYTCSRLSSAELQTHGSLAGSWTKTAKRSEMAALDPEVG